MAVQFNTNENYGYSILALFGVIDTVIEQAKNAGVKLDMSSPGCFVVKASDGTKATMVPIKTQAISLAKAGSMGPASKETIRAQLLSALAKAMDMPLSALVPAKGFSEPQAKPTAPKVSASDILAKMTKGSGSTPEHIKKINPILAGGGLVGDATVVANVAESIKKHFSSACKLKDATEVYQPVTGTSKSSIYYVVARLKGLNLAARCGSSSLSFRVEGDALEEYDSALSALGFTVKPTYASVHFECSQDMASKTVGAIIGGLGMANLLQAADIQKVMGK